MAAMADAFVILCVIQYLSALPRSNHFCSVSISHWELHMDETYLYCFALLSYISTLGSAHNSWSDIQCPQYWLAKLGSAARMVAPLSGPRSPRRLLIRPLRVLDERRVWCVKHWSDGVWLLVAVWWIRIRYYSQWLMIYDAIFFRYYGGLIMIDIGWKWFILFLIMIAAWELLMMNRQSSPPLGRGLPHSPRDTTNWSCDQYAGSCMIMMTRWPISPPGLWLAFSYSLMLTPRNT